ncbi:50S ribosomal protein L3 [candidate division KSB3 bacterium]|uniref:Large ribosomal subunit protein uL3 n=1 Tax=candidate division KSB3 bacterium TaxID=2044937 RepID=A0A2G6E7L6_9BACT|nr:MAG: 50S ribosomal protein L3 [candidate division KSB3 bacterium]PIE30299.1 MAG: 50S ribosomal protein L3 [candidate division KSB3 bacterium]
MPIGILGRKIGMTQVFDENNKAVPVTVIEAGPCPIVQKKTDETDRYNAIQLGFLDQKERRVNKPRMGHFAKAKVAAKRFLREIRLDAEEIQAYEVGQELNVDLFDAGEAVDITGYTKGRGFTGVMKRWNFAGAATQTHGTHEYFRHGGSIGAAAWPSRVFKGRKMAGQKGNDRVTIQNLEVVGVRPEKNVLLVKGSVPGAQNGLLIIRKAKKKQQKKS